MRQDAEQHAEEDNQRKQMIDLRNQAESEVYGLETSKKEYADVLTEEENQKIDDAMNRARKAIEGDDKAELEAATQNLKDVSSPIYQEAYQRRQQQQGQNQEQNADQQQQDQPESESDNKNDSGFKGV
mgnify:CR=1 FL=1